MRRQALGSIPFVVNSGEDRNDLFGVLPYPVKAIQENILLKGFSNRLYSAKAPSNSTAQSSSVIQRKAAADIQNTHKILLTVAELQRKVLYIGTVGRNRLAPQPMTQ